MGNWWANDGQKGGGPRLFWAGLIQVSFSATGPKNAPSRHHQYSFMGDTAHSVKYAYPPDKEDAVFLTYPFCLTVGN